MSSNLEKLKNGGVKVSGFSDDQKKLVEELTDNEIETLVSVHKKAANSGATTAGTDGGLIF